MRDIVAGTLAVLLVVGLFLVRPGPLASLDDRVCDQMAAFARREASGRVAIVEIDDKSLAQFGRWPWSRDLIGLLAQRTLEQGAAAVVFDMMFPEPDAAHDGLLAQTIANKAVVVGYTFTFGEHSGGTSPCGSKPLPLVSVSPSRFAGESLFHASGAICSVPELSAAAAANGFLNAAPERDGRLRRIPLVIESGGAYYPSLALAALTLSHRTSIQLLADEHGVSELHVGSGVIPLEGRGLMRLRFRGPRRTFPYASAADVLSQQLPEDRLRNKIVVIGGSALGLENMSATPLDAVFPGVEVQATAIDNLLLGDSFHRPLESRVWELLLALVVGIGAAFLLARVRYLWGSLVTAIFAAGLCIGCGFVLSGTGVVISPLPAGAALACNLAILTLVSYAREKNRAERTGRQLESARKTAREALEESQQRYQRLVENVNDAIVVNDVHGRLVFANRRFREWFGLEDADIGRAMIEDWVAPEWQVSLRDAHDQRMRGVKVPDHYEYECIRHDGTRIWIEALIATVEENGKITGAQAALRDVTRRKQIEERYLQAQKMETVGRLAGGVAHDFNNLLTVINGYTDLLLRQTDRQDPRREDLEQVRAAGERAKELTQKLLVFSRRQLAEPRPLNLSMVVSEAQKMFGRLLGEDIELVTRLAQDTWQVMADPGQFHQVLMNLAVNARDAMPNGGKLVIETSNATVGEDLAVTHPGLPPGDYVYVGVTDTGTGMSTDVKQHLFEPFFTTKEVGRGTGLGLATVYGIVRQSGGWIGVTSELGSGTTFHIYIPRIDSQAPADADSGLPKTVPHGCETVLVVEDQEEVRRLIITMLCGYGYSILEASNGPAAIQVAESYPGRIHLLLTDVVLPFMNGRTLADRLLAARPGIKVLFTSGYAQETIGHHGVLESGLTYLPKPFTPEMLASKVREALTNSDGGTTGDRGDKNE